MCFFETHIKKSIFSYLLKGVQSNITATKGKHFFKHVFPIALVNAFLQKKIIKKIIVLNVLLCTVFHCY